MGRRYTETAKWDDPFFYDLPPQMKLMWIYLVDKCDASGVIDFSAKVASAQIGWEYDEAEVLIMFTSRIEVLPSGKWKIKKFLKFQYGEHQSAPAPSSTEPLPPATDQRFIVQQLRDIYLKHNPSYAKDDTFDFEAIRKIVEFLKKQMGLQTITEKADKDKMEAIFSVIANMINSDNFYSTKPLKTVANNIQAFYMEAVKVRQTSAPAQSQRKRTLKERYLSPTERDKISLQEWEVEYDTLRPSTKGLDMTYINQSYEQGTPTWKKAVLMQMFTR